MADDMPDAAQKIIDAAANQVHPVSDPSGTASPLAHTPTETATQRLLSQPLPQPIVPQPEQPPASTTVSEEAGAASPPLPPETSLPPAESTFGAERPAVAVSPPTSPPPPFPQKKSSAGGIILGVLALLLLALPISIYYISQQNQQLAEIRSRASGPYPTDCTNYADPVCRPWDYFCFPNDRRTICGRNKTCNSYDPQTCPNCEGGKCCTNGYYPCTGGCCKIGRGGGGGGGGSTNVCQNIKIYKNGVQIDPTTLQAGDQVQFGVKGSGSPTKGRFRINGGSWSQTTTRNSQGEFVLDFTIPEGVTNFAIEAEVFVDGEWR